MDKQIFCVYVQVASICRILLVHTVHKTLVFVIMDKTVFKFHVMQIIIELIKHEVVSNIVYLPIALNFRELPLKSLMYKNEHYLI